MQILPTEDDEEAKDYRHDCCHGGYYDQHIAGSVLSKDSCLLDEGVAVWTRVGIALCGKHTLMRWTVGSFLGSSETWCGFCQGTDQPDMTKSKNLAQHRLRAELCLDPESNDATDIDLSHFNVHAMLMRPNPAAWCSPAALRQAVRCSQATHKSRNGLPLPSAHAAALRTRPNGNVNSPCNWQYDSRAPIGSRFCFGFRKPFSEHLDFILPN